MGFCLSKNSMNQVLKQWSDEYLIYAPKRIIGNGTFSDVDVIRYDKVDHLEEIVFDEKSEYSFKEILLPISETLFYFTENEVKEPDYQKKGAIIFLRNCDLNAVRVLDDVYLKQGYEDHYYARIRKHVKFVLMGCETAFDTCFCVDMDSNESTKYDASIDLKGDQVFIDNKYLKWEPLLKEHCDKVLDVTPETVKNTETRVNIPAGITIDVMKSKQWDEYDSRCIDCGRCNFVCPTCTCFTMQDIFYTDNEKAGERRRVWASCMVDGFTDVAGGGSYRKGNGQRMRFKVLHKVYDYKKRNGYHMCVGCGRCDDVCPEYISFSNSVNKLESMIQEVKEDE